MNQYPDDRPQAGHEHLPIEYPAIPYELAAGCRAGVEQYGRSVREAGSIGVRTNHETTVIGICGDRGPIEMRGYASGGLPPEELGRRFTRLLGAMCAGDCPRLDDSIGKRIDVVPDDRVGD